jgi:uncharacterized protein (TIGR02466 family)
MFSTPIITYRVKDPAALNKGLKQSILATERGYSSTRRSNIGGWRSDHDLLEWPGTEIKLFDAEIQKAIGEVIASTTGEQGFNGYLKVNAWANLLRRGNYNTIHNHPESAWSGVYYVDAGTLDPSNPLSGVLELLDPRPFVEMVAVPGAPFGRPVRIDAENGLMVLFPSWLYHHVHAYTGTNDRIAIAFNVSAMPATMETPEVR